MTSWHPRITTEVTVNLGYVETRLAKANLALKDGETDEAMQVLTDAQVNGVSFDYSEQASPLADARDAIWLAKRALEEDNPVQAAANLRIARQRLRVYRELLTTDAEREEVEQMLSEVRELESQLREESESNEPASTAERTRQHRQATGWWDRISGWFRDRF